MDRLHILGREWRGSINYVNINTLVVAEMNTQKAIDTTFAFFPPVTASGAISFGDGTWQLTLTQSRRSTHSEPKGKLTDIL